MEKQYAFLNIVYCNQSANEKIYEVVFSTFDFEFVSVYRTDIEGLKALAEDDTLCVDFAFEDGFLKCADVRQVQNVDTKSFQMNKEIVFLNSEDGSVLDLIKCGAKHSFKVVDKCVADSCSWTGNGIAGFDKIRFSQSSMSVFVRMVTGNEMRNLYLVKLDRGMLAVEPFMFIVPLDAHVTPPVSIYVKNITVNNIEYRLYRVNSYRVYKDLGVISHALINKAACMRNKHESAIHVLSLYSDRMFLHEENKLKWVGEKKRQTAFWGVNFKSSIPKITKNDANGLLTIFEEEYPKCREIEEFSQRLKERGLNQLCINILVQLGNACSAAKTPSELFDFLNQIIAQHRSRLLNLDLYLYKIRVFLFFSGKHLSYGEPLCGSNEFRSYTIVEEGLHYGE